MKNIVLLAVAASIRLAAQTGVPPVTLGPVTLSGSIRNRTEAWTWFAARPAEHTYTFNGSTLRLAIKGSRPSFDWTVEVEAPVLLHLPANAVAPGNQGQLGQGATYFVANHRRSNTASLFPKQVNLRWKHFGFDHAALRVGRFEFQDGSETPASDPTLNTLRRERVQQRLLGPFVFTHVMRSFDGFEYAYNHAGRNYTVIAATPTRGVFQVDGWGWLKVAFAYGSASRSFKTGPVTGEWRIFALEYLDWRHVVKADNRALPARSADLARIQLQTYGAHFSEITKTRAGSLDLVTEFALQTGTWGSQQHRAGMALVEGGYQPQGLKSLRPWFRAGYYWGSGDDDPGDARHATFFQVLPTARPYAQFPFYNMMNNVDRFAIIIVRPHQRLAVKSEIHSLRLAARNDLWYLGGGAFQPWSFGYQSRSAGGARSLANLWSATVEVNLNPHVSLAPYVGYAAGRSAVRFVYPQGSNGHLAFLEATVRF